LAKINIILHGDLGTAEHDTREEPITLSYGDDLAYDEAGWDIPDFPGPIPGQYVSEIRILEGQLQVQIKGPAGFSSGPHATDWIRARYPRGKDFSLLLMTIGGGRMSGVSVGVEDEKVVVSDF
jgi:hypothetical protein